MSNPHPRSVPPPRSRSARRLRPDIAKRGLVLLLAVTIVGPALGAQPDSTQLAPLPEGVRVVWDPAKAFRETTPTRERICLNGLWRWQSAATESEAVPAGSWGFFKVPGAWPGITDYMQKDSQTVFRNPAWSQTNLRDVKAAWYEREISVPSGWSGRNVSVSADCLNSYAAVFIDGQRAGELRFPGGTLDITALCRPGATHLLTVRVTALPLEAVMRSYSDTASVKDVQARVERRGLCGDVFLESKPTGPHLETPRITTSVRQGTITFRAAARSAVPGSSYQLQARIRKGDKEVQKLASGPLAVEAGSGDLVFAAPWKRAELWDLDTPGNQFEAELTLQDAGGRVLDVLPPARFGFRELWIDGKDFVLNGTRLFLSALPLDNAQVGPASATYEAARESLLRLQTLGINFVYAHNYGCEPGTHLAFGEILRAADDVGMLVALTAPHFGQYGWGSPEAEATNRYALHAAYYTGIAGNHPSVVFYSTSHNATGYNEDMNPDLLDGRFNERDQWSANNARKALRAEAIIKRLDPDRIVYHHASGNLGSVHSINFYPNFTPVQELSDWFGPWAAGGTKPLFLCEYGGPFTWDWAMYRGWYRGKREFGSAVVPWEFCLAEWNAQFLGDRAFDISPMEKRNLRWEAAQFRAGKTWHRWDYPHQLGSADFPEREPVMARYYEDNWRAFRTWGLSGNSPWEHHVLFTTRRDLNRNQRTPLPVDWDNLQRPGISPDYVEERFERMDMAYERSDWIPTLAARALMRNNRPFLAWIAGKPEAFTSKDHVFRPGDSFTKQLILINSSRRRVHAEASWVVDLPDPANGRVSVEIGPGEQVRLPLRISLPKSTGRGTHTIQAAVKFGGGETQEDRFTFEILPDSSQPRSPGRLAVFDPKGETTAFLRELGVAFTPVDANSDLSAHDILVVGKAALTIDSPSPALDRVREGLRVLVFEQTAEALEQRLGFRVASYGLRGVFPRVPSHPALSGLEQAHLTDWRGEATLLSPRLKYQLNPKFNGAPTVSWCGIDVTRAWRCGCRGNVASVLIEKPACGDFLPLIDGGFSLQYSPLLEYREGSGLVVFCQLDVTGRTESEPVARMLAANLISYMAAWKPTPAREPRYAGVPAGLAHLQASGIQPQPWTGGPLAPHELLILGPGMTQPSPQQQSEVATFLRGGGCLLALGLDGPEANGILPASAQVTTKTQEYINAFFPPPSATSPLAGIGPADVHNRDPRQVPLVVGGAATVGGGVLASSSEGSVVFCALAPWSFDYRGNYGLKRTFRRTSVLVTRLLGNLGVRSRTPLLDRWKTPVAANAPGRWLTGFYLETPEEWDDPYRFFRW